MRSFILRNFVACCLLMITGILHADEIYSKTEAANRLYKQGKFDEALKLYEDALLLSPAEDNLKINRGAALYQKGDLDGAEKSSQAALSAKEKKSRAAAHYNLGNIQFRKGENLMQQDAGKAQEQFKQALDNYIKTLDLNSTDFDAKWNLQLAHNRVQQMKQQQEQQQKNDKNQQNKDEKNDQSKQDQNSDKQQEQNKNDQQEDKNKEQQDKGQDKNQDQQKQENDKQQQPDEKDKEQQAQPQPAQQDSAAMKKDEARRIIELYADDADSLNKPVKKGIGRQSQPEKDW